MRRVEWGWIDYMSRADDDPEIVDALRAVVRLARLAEQVCDEVGLTLPQYRGLSFIATQRRRAHEIAAMTATSRGTITSLTTGLERLGLVERGVAEDDRRGVHFVATAKGRRVLRKVDRRLAAMAGSVLGAESDRLRSLGASEVRDALDRRALSEFLPGDR